jgi:hypothetical protein
MAQGKTMSMTHQFLTNATSPTAETYTVVPEVSNGVLTPGHRRINPGIFTAGTASEEYGGANVNQDSNS